MKRFLSIFLCLILLFGSFGCSGKENALAPKEEKQEEERPAEQTAVLDGSFNADLRAYFKENGFGSENYVFSPLSLKAALCLAIEGANGLTREELIRAAGFQSYEDVLKWYVSVLEKTDRFLEDLNRENERLEREKQYMPEDLFSYADRSFSVANSVWNNRDVSGPFLDSYRERVGDQYQADVKESSKKTITDDVNAWVNEKTNGMIPRIADDLSTSAAILANALYLRTSWVDSFSEYETRKDSFTCFDGSVSEKDFMESERHIMYYEDGETQIAVLPMDGDIHYVMVLGSSDSLPEKLQKTGTELVHLRFPKLDIESTFGKEDLIGFLSARGARLAFDKNLADFSAMADTSKQPWYIDDIVQKAKIKTDEEGLEASAATVIMVMAGGAFLEEPEQPKEFIADRPFEFFVFSELYGDQPEILFCGQEVR